MVSTSEQNHARRTLRMTYNTWKVPAQGSRASPKLSPHSGHVRECGPGVFYGQWWPPGTLRLTQSLRLHKLLRHRGQQGYRRSSSTPSSLHAEVSPTRPEEPSLASVGSGMAAGAAFGHPRVRGARVRPNFFNHI